MTERKSQFQKLIESQCRTLKKEKLILICEQYAHKQFENDNKGDMTKILFDKVMKDLKKMKEDHKSAQQMQEFLITLWKKYGLNPLSNSKLQVLKSTAHSFSNDQGLVQIARSSSVPNLSQRAPRQPLTQIAMNILHDSKKCICQQGDKHEKIESPKQPCYYCGAMLHPECLWPKERKDDVFECPFCFIKMCNPAREVKQAVCASYLLKKNRQKCETKIKFNVPFELKKDKSAIFQLRCVRLGCKVSRYEITFPDSCSISVNGKKISEFKPLPKNTPLKRRPDQQIKIQKNLIVFGQNQLKIDEKGVTHTKQQYPGKAGKYDHIIMVVAVYPRTLKEIQNNFLKKFQEKNSISITHLQEVVKKNGILSGDLQIEKIKIPMYCQFYGGRICIPVRSRHCTHNNAFDAKNYFMAMIGNTKTSVLKWKCPLCKKRSYDLVLDSYLLGIIQKFKDRKIKQIIVNPKNLSINNIEIIDQQPDSQQEDPYQRKSIKPRDQIKADINIDDSDQINQGHQSRQRLDYQQQEIRNASSQVYTANRHSLQSQNNQEDEDTDQIIEISETQFGNLQKKQKEKEEQETGKQIKRNAEYQLVQQERQSKGIRKMKVIQVDSQQEQESEQAAYKRRLEQHRKQLQEMRRFSSRKCKDNIITQQDVHIYQQVCKKFMKSHDQLSDLD